MPDEGLDGTLQSELGPGAQITLAASSGNGITVLLLQRGHEMRRKLSVAEEVQEYGSGDFGSSYSVGDGVAYVYPPLIPTIPTPGPTPR